MEMHTSLPSSSKDHVDSQKWTSPEADGSRFKLCLCRSFTWSIKKHTCSVGQSKRKCEHDDLAFHMAWYMSMYEDDSALYSSERRRAAGLVTLIPNTFALNNNSSLRHHARRTENQSYLPRIVVRFRLETPCAISAAKVLLCIKSRSNSRTLLTRNFLRPLGSRWRVCTRV